MVEYRTREGCAMLGVPTTHSPSTVDTMCCHQHGSQTVTKQGLSMGEGKVPRAVVRGGRPGKPLS